ncbi:hypothetical protein Peur_012237 [Populus x canadensis]
MLLALLTLVGDWCGRCYGCLEEERIGLLEIKALTNPNSFYMGDWVEYSSNCCEWSGIECNHTTGRVIRLSLFGARDQSLGDWVLNASLFLPFKELQSLDLSYNGLVGCSENEGFEVLSSKLRKLEVLYLSENRFNDDISILSCFNGLSALKSLDLSGNEMTGSGNFYVDRLKVLSSRLKKLENLDLRRNQCNDSIFSSITGFSSLKSLDLSDNQLTGSVSCILLRKLRTLYLLSIQPSLKTLSLKDTNLICTTTIFIVPFLLSLSQELHLDRTSLPLNFLQNIGTLPTLKVLSVGQCDLNGTLPAQGWCELKNLKQLDLSENNFGGSLPDCLGNLSSLQLLDVSSNQFTANIASSPLTNLICIESLSLSNNLFEVPISMKPFMNHSSLKFFSEQLTTIKFLKLSNNNLGGQILTSVFNSFGLYFLYLSGNNFWGQIPNFPPPSWKICYELGLNNNQFSGMLSRCFFNLKHIFTIDLSKNHFNGPIPSDFCKLEVLEYLDLSKNKLFGSIPSCFNRPQITHVHLSENRLSGLLTYGFYNSSSLVTMDLRDNIFTGSIPNWIGNLSSLSVLLLRANHFNGEFPIHLCWLEQLSILDVSQNQLSGPLSSCLGNLTFKASSKKALVDLEFVFPSRSIEKAYCDTMGPPLVDSIKNLESIFWPNTTEVIEFTTKNMYYGYKEKILTYMFGIDLSCNNFLGAIPQELGNLCEIHALNLSHNNLVGSIPATFANLKQIESLDLSYNNLNGAIPRQLTEITTLAVFSVAHNNLSGKTPERKYQFGTFDESSYEGNPFLYGPPLRNNCNEEESPSQPMPNDEQEDDGFIDMDFFYLNFGICYTIVVMTIAAVLYINPYWRRRWFYFIEDCIDTCNYFVVASFRKFSNFRR